LGKPGLNDRRFDRSDDPDDREQQFGIYAAHIAQAVDTNTALPHLVFMNTSPAHGQVNAVAAASLLGGQHAQLPFGPAALKRRNDVKKDHDGCGCNFNT
jgi:hypothetical protein